jgi:hypothetical protein
LLFLSVAHSKIPLSGLCFMYRRIPVSPKVREKVVRYSTIIQRYFDELSKNMGKFGIFRVIGFGTKYLHLSIFAGTSILSGHSSAGRASASQANPPRIPTTYNQMSRFLSLFYYSTMFSTILYSTIVLISKDNYSNDGIFKGN